MEAAVSALNITLKRVYLPPSSADGTRILVERLWPRGLTKDKAVIDHWVKDIAPTPELRKWYGHEPDRWAEFQRRYKEELSANGEELGRGLAAYSGEEAAEIIGCRSEQIESKLGYRGRTVMVHRDDLVLFGSEM